MFTEARMRDLGGVDKRVLDGDKRGLLLRSRGELGLIRDESL